ncbi:hypothetical protein [Massilia consociata]|uniref:Uncharacterized protein n=1 Tax=Massilia consociata TaxID=760117 RepID=A0ABV6FG56_9BURK
MNDPTRKVDPASKGPNVYYESDIGSGEKSPGELETEEMIRQIPPLPASGDKQDKEPSSAPSGAGA